MMSEILTRITAPFFVGLLWLGAAILIFRPGDGPGGLLAAGILGGLALTIAALAPYTANPRRMRARAGGRRIALAGLAILILLAALAPFVGAGGQLLNTPAGPISAAGLAQTGLEAGGALVIAGLIGEAVAQLTAKRMGP